VANDIEGFAIPLSNMGMVKIPAALKLLTPTEN
jgi:hypothetical protein